MVPMPSMPSMPTEVSIRSATIADVGSLHEICLRTGDGGNDATGLLVDGSLYGHIYAAPYLHLEPAFAFVADLDGQVAGYVVGALDTAVFEARCESDWWPTLRASHSLPAEGTDIDRRLVIAIHHPPITDPRVLERYPSHLHINLLPVAQGHGVGRRLITTLCDALRACGSIGVHLGVDPRNSRAIGFYEHVGMRRHDHDSGVLFTKHLVDR
jgi:ribosomal protein S18 acetylase RimI-like enzyme